MPPEQTQATHAGLPPKESPERQKAQGTLRSLHNWREASAATAIVMAAMLPFAIEWHVSYLTAIATSLISALALAFGFHLARARHLATLAIFPEFAKLPELAGIRERLSSAPNRHALASGLRRTAAPTQPPRRFDCCPVLPDRVAAVRPELLKLASALEQNTDPDPPSVALIHELLPNGCSPLYNPNIPAHYLYTTLTRAHAGITAQTTNLTHTETHTTPHKNHTVMRTASRRPEPPPK